jgi:hypothetical protein
VRLTFRLISLTMLMITGLATGGAAVAAAPAVSALTAPAAAPGTKLWAAQFQDLKDSASLRRRPRARMGPPCSSLVSP